MVGWADWRALAKEAHRLADADAAKMHWWSEGAHGQLPIEASAGPRCSMPEYHLQRSDARCACSRTRCAAARPVGAWRARARARRLSPRPTRATAGPRARAPHWRVSAHAPGCADTAARALERRDHRTTTRRLAEAFFSGVVAMPYAAAETATEWGVYTQSEETGLFESALRYVVYDTALARPPAPARAHPLLPATLTRVHVAVLPLPRGGRRLGHANPAGGPFSE